MGKGTSGSSKNHPDSSFRYFIFIFYFSLTYAIIFFLNHLLKVKSDDDDWDNWMDESQKELQNIFQGQSAMKEILTDLHRKMDDIISRQERAFNAISAIQVLYFET